jgi:hypothetical protein
MRREKAKSPQSLSSRRNTIVARRLISSIALLCVLLSLYGCPGLLRLLGLYDDTPPVIVLLGDNPLLISRGDTYKEYGATAHDEVDGDITDLIEIDSATVDTAVIGEYVVTYNVADTAGNDADEVIRTVYVVDTSAPAISLIGDNPLVLAVGENYPEYGAVAYDDVDGDITALIVIDGSAVDTTTVGEYAVTYNVTDSAGNEAEEKTRTVKVVDEEAPVITVLGDNPLTVYLGDEYHEYGATAYDYVDGDLTDAIIIGDEEVDVSAVGGFAVTYDVADSSGNAAEQKTRQVYVEAPIPEPPAGFVVEATNIDEVRFSWTPVAYATSYTIELSIHVEPDQVWGYNDTTQIPEIPGDASEYVFSSPANPQEAGIYPDYIYHFRIKAVGTYGESDWSYIWNFQTPGELGGDFYFEDDDPDSVVEGYTNDPDIRYYVRFENVASFRLRAESSEGAIIIEEYGLPGGIVEEWDAFPNEPPYFEPGDGVKTLWLGIADQFGNTMEFLPSIILDTQPPSEVYSVASFADSTLTINHYEWQTDGVIAVQVRYWYPSGSGGEWTFIFSNTTEWLDMDDQHVLSTPSVVLEYTITYRDPAGNTYTVGPVDL